MNILVLRPSWKALDYALFDAGRRRPALVGKINERDCGRHGAFAPSDAFRRVLEACRKSHAPGAPELVGIRLTFGGEEFTEPALVTNAVLERLRGLAHQAPLHLPPALALIERCRESLPEMPIILVFETAFFVKLPLRERGYGMDAGVVQELGIRRYGYHGIFHETACKLASRLVGVRGTSSCRRVLSICLEPRPEIAAVIGRRPVMVTSGATPLEGLPGQTACGELDPGIVLHLARKLGWGPEQINQCLTGESGLAGLTGHRITLDGLFHDEWGPAIELARQVMRYRMLLACGAGVAAMGWVDAIVFSGRYFDLGEVLGPWLAGRLAVNGRSEAPEIPWTSLHEPLDRLIADQVAAAFAGRAVLTAVTE